MHNFDDSKRVEARWSAVLDDWIRSDYSLTVASIEDEWRGIDRWATDSDGVKLGIDYKCDTRAAITGNIFVETVSNSQSGRLGWAYTSEADWIFYFVVPRFVLAFRTASLRRSLSEWVSIYRTARARNDRGYDTIGILVPLIVARSSADSVCDFGDIEAERQLSIPL